MPIINGKHVTLDAWRAIQAAPPVVAPPVIEPEPEVERPRRKTGPKSKHAAAEQVMAALGITPPAAETEDVSPRTSETEDAPTPEPQPE
jgi:hypothetical protein